MAVLGLGIGMILPVLVLAVQNSVPPADIGSATSANNYFRQIGGSVGAAVFGTLFANRLAGRLAVELPHGATPARPPVGHPPTRPHPARTGARRLHPGVRRRHAADLPLPGAGPRPRLPLRLPAQGETTGDPARPRRPDGIRLRLRDRPRSRVRLGARRRDRHPHRAARLPCGRSDRARRPARRRRRGARLRHRPALRRHLGRPRARSPSSTAPDGRSAAAPPPRTAGTR